ncbi:MAG: class I SAM-dependent methyltransferase [Candidatus Hermodarchaeota archaeon]|nr:class I SAM-dependent methyltransferase [Candidatus Hermodarchaeota archaeon]
MPVSPDSAPKRIGFGRVAEDYEITRGFPTELMKQLIEDIIYTCELAPTTLVLELGCGAGRYLRELAHRQIPVIGLDISPGMIDKARRNQQSRKYLRSNLLVSDAVTLPFHQGQFFSVIAIHLFHLLTDWQEVLFEALRVLQPGGTFVLGYVQGRHHGSMLDRLYRQRREELGYYYDYPGPHSSQISAELEAQGFRVEAHSFMAETEVPFQETLSVLERRVYSSMWEGLPDVVHRQLIQHVRKAASSQFKRLDDMEKITCKAELFFAAHD